MEPAELKTLVHRYFDCIAARDADGWVALHAEDAIFVDPVSAEPFVGHAALRGFFEQVGGLSSRLEVTDVEPVVVAPTTACVRWTARPTLRASGRTAAWPCVTTFHVTADGRIRHAIACWNHQVALAEAQAP